ncbi:hypothetical protein N7504_006820 [Penicillium tannophilum]|nr:hypothetical protein N7504_006820 [Penicillium tannophilum]
MTTMEDPMNVLNCIALVVAEYMSVNRQRAEKPKDGIMNNLFNVPSEDSGGPQVLSSRSRIKSMTSASGLIEAMQQVFETNIPPIRSSRRPSFLDRIFFLPIREVLERLGLGREGGRIDLGAALGTMGDRKW